jgi:broad specificity phosphatase PhoE
MIALQKRMVSFVEEINNKHKEKTFAIVSHGDPIKTLLLYYLGMPVDLIFRFRVDAPSVSILELNEWGAEILGINLKSNFL